MIGPAHGFDRLATALALFSSVAGCFYDWRYHPPDNGEGGSGSGSVTTGQGGAAPDPAGCKACTAATDACSEDVAGCEFYEACVERLGCTDVYTCVDCIKDNQDGYSRWTCLQTLCRDACAGLPSRADRRDG